MKRILSIVFALALAGGLLSGCDRPAGTGGTASPSGSTSGSASGSAGSTSDQEKKSAPAPTTPSTPVKPSGTK